MFQRRLRKFDTLSLPPVADSDTMGQRDSVFYAAPPKVNQLTDNIYELYTPGATSRLRLDVVFFHGLQLDTSDAHLSTWTSRGSNEVWPMIWLPGEFPEARILCVKYDARTTRSAEYGRLDLHNAAENLIVSLIHAKVGQHPIILVGHCYGGLLIKQLCLQAHMSETLRGRDAEFLNCVKGVFFYGTPHRGSSFFENVPVENVGVLSKNVGVLMDASPLLDFVKVLCADSARLHENFDSLRSTHKWRIAGVGESHHCVDILVLCANSARFHENFDSLLSTRKWRIAGVGESHTDFYKCVAALRSQYDMFVFYFTLHDFSLLKQQHQICINISWFGTQFFYDFVRV